VIKKKNKMDRACSAYGGGEAYTGIWWGNLRERDHLGDRGVGGLTVLMWILKKLDIQLRPPDNHSNTATNGRIVQLIKRFIHSATSGRARVRFRMLSLEFFIDIILPAALWHWDRLSV